ncbi:MAG TPA: aldehyde ferredoxin oxidoreductase family protein [Methanomassiliicoccales archaeon]|nr:aldehyde ferredoxin oxidoreductase family protein [Methanomassiliicoccales archaeon]
MHAVGGKILYVDLTSGEVRTEEVTPDLVKKYLGGDGLAVKLFTDNMDPSVEPFDDKNVLVFAPGLFTGLPVPTGGKCLFLSRSPLTGTIAESVMGGNIGAELKMAGYDAIVITGKSDNPCVLSVWNDIVEIKDGSPYWGMVTREAQEAIRGDLKVSSVACIGPAGEKLVRYATIDCEDRQSGRAGLGAVMGSKNLKAIAVRGTKDLTVADPEGLIELVLKLQDTMEKSGAFVDDTKYGTGEFLNWINEERGVFPTRNWQESVFEARKEIDPYYWAPRYTLRSKGCFGCTKACGKLFVVQEGKYSGTKLDGIEYETLYSLGGECSNPDIEALARANEVCDLLGIDTISAGVCIGFTMELVERGILSTNEVGMDCRFGNPDAVVEMSEMIGRRQGFGEILGEGVMRAAKEIGNGVERYAMHVKGMEPPAYDVRGIKGMGLGFMTSPRGACHLRSGVYALNLVGKFWRWENVDRFTAEGKGEQVKAMEDFMTVYDSLGVCRFSRGFFLIDGYIPFVRAIMGYEMSEEEILQVGERVNNLKQLFNYSVGVRREDFYLPRRLTEEPIKDGVAKGAIITEEEMHRMLDDYLDVRGWENDGKPGERKLRELKLA